MSDIINIVIDTREQTPWGFDAAFANVRTGTLRTGDYALDGDACFAIERKTLGDFLGTISSGWARFCKEVYRAKEAQFPAFPIIVEGVFSSVCFQVLDGQVSAPAHNHPRLSPAFVVKRIAELTLMGCQVIFAERPEYAGAIALKLLQQRAESLAAEN
ncbi:MAG: ERCC4 domain-containing protein [Kiritimatiellaeota bacterium]|nr:ERCC4 domain-containing protein [Kiritimatiellota bacterium]